MDKSPTLEDLAEALKKRAAETYSVEGERVSVTVDARYQVVAVKIHGVTMEPEERAALEAGLLEAVNGAMRAAVTGAARAFGSLPSPSHVKLG